MSNWMDVLPCRGVEVDVWSQDGDIVLKTPSGLVSLVHESEEDDEGVVHHAWDVYRGEDYMCFARTPEQCLWFVLALYGEGDVAWDDLHRQLFGGE